MSTSHGRDYPGHEARSRTRALCLPHLLRSSGGHRCVPDAINSLAPAHEAGRRFCPHLAGETAGTEISNFTGLFSCKSGGSTFEPPLPGLYTSRRCLLEGGLSAGRLSVLVRKMSPSFAQGGGACCALILSSLSWTDSCFWLSARSSAALSALVSGCALVRAHSPVGAGALAQLWRCVALPASLPGRALCEVR